MREASKMYHPQTESYELLRESRAVLLEFCAGLGSDVFQKIATFGDWNIRDTLVHILNIYELWIARNSLNKTVEFSVFEQFKNIETIKMAFADADGIMAAFFAQFPSDAQPIEVSSHGNTMELTSGQIAFHVITHECHHKGQILKLARMLGHQPPDTDIIRTL